MNLRTPVSVDGQSIRLVPMGPQHARPMTDALQDPRISQTTTIPFPYTLEMAEENIAGSAQRWNVGGGDWAIEAADNGEFLGRLELIASTRTPDQYELAFFCRSDRWNQGIMSQAVRVAVNLALDEWGATRVEWFAHIDNWASWKPVWKCGFKREGVRRSSGGDLWQAAILPSDPRQPASPWDGPGSGRGPALDPSRPQALVEQFHRTYSMPIRLGSGAAPTIDYERLHMRMSLITEEFAELLGAVYGPQARRIIEEAVTAAVASDEHERDLVETADALADLVYVIYGMGIESGIDLDKVLAEVQASNLSKLMPDGTVKLREDGKVLKGPDFFAPNVRRALGLGEEQ
ncbi:GNAT family N-acetyltransferase [Schaalia vaccimaxillae]|uniref:GNAT family N-acetyltransferase n=1 Tax=Schaalia vaccimaxillae TaxID=183916 RepID=UPI0003B5C807|nr:GNAT family N-acetyltransferase [Schaalia vaccimaxillae]